MYKNVLFSLFLLSSVSLINAVQPLTLDEKVERRFDFIIKEHASAIQTAQERVELLQNFLEKILSCERKKSLTSALQEKFEAFLVNLITKIKNAQETYLVKMAVVYKKLTSDKITKAEMKESSALYMKHLELFSDEIAFLIKLLLPLKDLDTMTEEEIQAALTF